MNSNSLFCDFFFFREPYPESFFVEDGGEQFDAWHSQLGTCGDSRETLNHVCDIIFYEGFSKARHRDYMFRNVELLTFAFSSSEQICVCATTIYCFRAKLIPGVNVKRISSLADSLDSFCCDVFFPPRFFLPSFNTPKETLKTRAAFPR